MKKYIVLLSYCLIITNLLVGCGSKNVENSLADNNYTNKITTISKQIAPVNETSITQPKVITQMTSDITKIDIAVGNNLQIVCSLMPEDAPQDYKTIIWSSSDSTIASVDENGLVTGIENGMCTITAISYNNPDVILKFPVNVTGSIKNTIAPATTIYIPKGEFTTTTKATPPTTTTIIQMDTEPPQTVINNEYEYTQEEIIQSIEVTDTSETIPEKTTTITTTTTPPPQIQATFINDILLVNDIHPLPESYVPPQDQVGEYGIYSYVQEAFYTMSTDASIEGLNLSINTGYVSYDEQNSKYQSLVSTYGDIYASLISDSAGYSESQTGLSILLNTANETFDNSAEAIWVAENCYKYGFIIRYPQGKESITNKNYRSFQLRYVGIDIATDIYNQNLCLEEYLGE